MSDKPEPRYEASAATKRNILGDEQPAMVRHIYRDGAGHKATEFIPFQSTTRDNDLDARICAEALATHFGEALVLP